MFTKRTKERATRPESGDIDPATGLDPQRIAFLEQEYLKKPYILPPDVEAIMHEASDSVRMHVPSIACIVNVGGTANGSLALRRLEGRKMGTDLDFYLVGHGAADPNVLSRASTIVDRVARARGITLDGELNGRRPTNYLNLDDVDAHIANEDFNLLSLPFQSAFGDVVEAQRQILRDVVSRPDGQAVWDEIANYHIQSLSMHHGSWPTNFANTISQQYYPQKIELFQLPVTPAEALITLQSESRTSTDL